jgi:hypothetical protein
LKKNTILLNIFLWEGDVNPPFSFSFFVNVIEIKKSIKYKKITW